MITTKDLEARTHLDKWGYCRYPNSWMLCFMENPMENPTLKWMNWGYQDLGTSKL
jgi:hypothetical protein